MEELLVLLIDISPSMANILPEVEKLCSMLLEKKRIYSNRDEVGAVLFGAQKTRNQLTEELGGYEHVAVLGGMEVVDGDLVDAFHQLPRGTVPGDFIDALVVGVDLMIKKYGPTNKGKKRICLITDALSPVRDAYEGTKGDQVGIVAQYLYMQGIKLECIVVRENITSGTNKTIMDENDQLWDIISEKALARIQFVNDSVSLGGALKKITEDVEDFQKCFELKVNPKMKKSAKRLRRDIPSSSDDKKDGAQGENTDIKLSITARKSSNSETNVDKIGDLTPVQDFEAMLSRKDSLVWVRKAIKGMRKKILWLIEDSYEGDNYGKALECLLALRKGCIVEQASKQFNEFIQYICKYCREVDLSDFVEVLSSNNMKLITKTEAADSEVEEDEAGRFLLPETEPKLEMES